MESSDKKYIKKTTVPQFHKLVELMDEHPQLATCSPTFGSSKMAVEETWCNLAKQLNSLGPPTRTASDWKKVWQDQKCRVKKKISENNKSIHGTGGGPCSVSNLTQLELHIDRICHLSSAAAPSGNVLGLPSYKTVAITPPRASMKVAVVTPTSSKQTLNKHTPDVLEKIIYIENDDLQLSSEILYETLSPSKQKTTSTPKERRQQFNTNRKRKAIDNDISGDRMKLLLQQTDAQIKTLEIMNKHAEAAQIQADSAKVQAEAAKVQAEAAKINAQSTLEQTKALQEIAESCNIMSKTLVDLLNHLKDDD